MSDLPARIASLSPAKRELLARRLRRTLEEAGEAIPRRERTSPVPVSPAQERLFFLHQLDAKSVAYNLSQAYRLAGPVDAGAIQEAFVALLARHESLRTTFGFVDAQAVQIIAPPGPFELAVLAADSVEQAQQLVNEDARRPFDLAAGPLLRARLIRLDERDHVLAVTMHHIISDGWSVAVLWMDLSAFYSALTAGQDLPLREMPVQYADFALWQRGRLSGELVERQLAYWRERLRGAPAAVDLPFDRQPPAPRDSGGGAWSEVWPRSLADAIAGVGLQAHATPFMTHLAAFAVLLARHTGQDEVIIGSPIAARSAVETESMIGFFVNTLPLRIDLSGRPDFPELLARVRATMLAAHESQDVPFDVLVADLKGDRAQGRAPLVQVMFGFQEARRTYLALPGVSVTAFPAETGAAKAELTVELLQRPEGLDMRFEYDRGLFDPGTIERMGGHYRRLVESIVADPRRPVTGLPMLSAAEGRQLVVEWNDTAREYLRAGSVNALVESWAARTPEALAAVAGEASLTYRQLNARANRLARGLAARGLRPEECVGVCLERSLDTVVAMLAVLKARGAYVPLEPHYPPARLAGMLAEAGARIVLTRSNLRHALPEGGLDCLCLDTDWAGLPADETDLPAADGPDGLAYVIYTSGSTGAPKGVAVTHRAILRLVVNADYAPLTPADVVAQASNTSFDAATFEIWGPLANGGRLVVVPTETLLAPRELGEEIRRRGITTMFVTTALFNRIAEEHPRAFASLKHLLFGGEASDPAAVAKVLAEGRPERLVHVYGPTEATTFATWHEVTGLRDGAATVPIGRPIANTTAYVLDEALAPVPLGVRGQLCIGGPGVARGYLNDPALTAQRFVPDPWDPRGRLYLTGDVARRLIDGEIEWLARRDEQVKIRGFRVEPGEIESALRGLADVREAVVVARADESGAKALVAYVVAAPAATRERLRDELARRLPAYLIPSAFVLMDRLPLTPNGKVDRGALPAPAREGPRFRAPRNGLERELAAIWQDVLGVEPIGLDQNFFDDLGGHSLLAVRLFARIEKQLGRKLPIAALFDSPTVESLAAVLEREGWSGQALPAVTLCSQGAAGPFFCVTPMDAFAYLDLARAMGGRRPFHVLHPLALVDAHQPVVDIEALADHYVAQVRAIQPEGPYLLGGYSVGGVIAYETACRLQRQGQRVAALVLFDAWCPPHGLTARLNRLVRWRIIRYARTLGRLPGRDKLAYLLNAFRPRARRELLQRAAGRVYVNDEDPVARYWRPFHGAYKLACRRYRPGPFVGRPVQFLCAKEPMELIDPRLLWRRVASGGLALRRIRGDHRVMLQAPLVQAVADELNAILAEAESAVRA